MESSVPMILPKGIVINTANIYDEVASYSTVPADKVWEYWHGTSLLTLCHLITPCVLTDSAFSIHNNQQKA